VDAAPAGPVGPTEPAGPVGPVNPVAAPTHAPDESITEVVPTVNPFFTIKSLFVAKVHSPLSY
jgi:hypothetical protein